MESGTKLSDGTKQMTRTDTPPADTNGTAARLSTLITAKRIALDHLAAAEKELDRANAALGEFAKEERKKWSGKR